MKILIAESDPVTSRIIKKNIENWGHQAILATDGEEALNIILSDEKIQFAIINWMLPKLDGIELSKQIRKLDRKNYTYLIMCTSKQEQDSVQEAINAGIDDFIIKPISVVELKNRVNIALSHLRSLWQKRVMSAKLDKEIKDRNKKLIKAKKNAEKSVKLKSEFLANMSHEIRTPLNGIISLVDLVLDEELGDEVREDIVTIKDCAHSLKTIIGDILDFSKIEANKMLIAPIEFNLIYFINKIEKIIEPLALDKNIEILWAIDPNISQNIIGDTIRIQQIITNLCSNAVKFTSEKGGMIIFISEKQIDDKYSEFQFSVADSGIGIPKENQSKIFEAFTQADSSVTRTHGGTGLGLTICSELARLMQGEICFESKEGMGSVFHLKLPLRVVKSKEIVEGANLNNSKHEIFNDLNVLLVEDDKVNRDTITRSLKKLGYNVISAIHGKDALKVLSENKTQFDIILTDMQMPEMDGIEFTKLLKMSALEHSKIPVIAVTANAEAGTRDECRAAGIVDFITKPIDFSLLSKAIDKVLAN